MKRHKGIKSASGGQKFRSVYMLADPTTGEGQGHTRKSTGWLTGKVGFIRTKVRPEAKLLSARRSGKPSGEPSAREKLRLMVGQLPPEKLQIAADMLKSLMSPAPTDSTVTTATDEEFRAVAAQTIAQYKPALERLAKR